MGRYQSRKAAPEKKKCNKKGANQPGLPPSCSVPGLGAFQEAVREVDTSKKNAGKKETCIKRQKVCPIKLGENEQEKRK